MRMLRHIIISIFAFSLPFAVQAQQWQMPYVVAEAAVDNVPQGRFIISNQDIENEVAKVLSERDVAEYVKARLTSTSNPVIFQAREPMKLALHNLSIDKMGYQWQAQAYMLSGGKTLSVVPVSGRYDILSEVPVLLHQVSAGQVIKAADVTTTLMPERQLRNDVLTQNTDIIGKTPRRGISAQRPIRSAELTTPRLVEKGKTVEIRYTTAHMSILGRGEALENGSLGETIRIKNLDSERTISARIVGINLAEANLAAPIETEQNYR
jgi:flagella basal body P-ring formation protein FlgA